MMGHKICFYGKIWLIIPKLSLIHLLIWSTAVTYILESLEWELFTSTKVHTETLSFDKISMHTMPFSFRYFILHLLDFDTPLHTDMLILNVIGSESRQKTTVGVNTKLSQYMIRYCHMAPIQPSTAETSRPSLIWTKASNF